MPYSRQLCSTERAYVVFNEFLPPFVNQFFWEGAGCFDLARWQAAVAEASAANPGSRVVIRGVAPWARLVDSAQNPPVHLVNGGGWDGLGSEGMPERLNAALDPFKGPSAEVVLIEGRPLRVVFRSHHAVMDGRGNLTWAEDVFRCLRGEKPLGSNSTLTEFEIAASFQKRGRGGPTLEYIAPTGKPQAAEPGVVWRRQRLAGRYRDPIGQLAVLLAHEAWLHAEGKVRFAVPVDMRPRVEGLRSTGNLTNLIYTELTPTTTPEQVTADIRAQLAAREDGRIYWGDRPLRFIPFWLLRRLIRRSFDQKNQTGLYPNSGVISKLGRMPVLSGGGFEGDYCWVIPPRQEYSAIFVGMLNTDDDLTLIYSLSHALAGGGRLDELMERVARGLVAS